LDDAQIGQTYTVRLPGGVEMKLCYSPPTNYRTEPFLMGSPESEDWHDKTEQQIEVRLTNGFWMAQTECTQAQWCAITEALHDNSSNKGWEDVELALKGDSIYDKVETKRDWRRVFRGLKEVERAGHIATEINPSYPIANISWNEVHDTFLRKLKERVPLPNGWTWSLPTEAEWEWACRAGSSGPWGNREDRKMGSLEEMGWYLTSQTHEVNTKKPNAWGLHDMHGSVWEWCSDSWNGETMLPGGQNPISQFGTEKVVRGGGFLSVASDCRAAKRGHRQIVGTSTDSSSSSSSKAPKTITYPTFNDVGFRLVVVPSNEAAVREKPGNKTN
jgi:formylglycine-generating enzyme required for sulfatase activity